MPTVTNLTKKEVENIQIDEGLVYVDYGEETERKIAPTRGGGEFVASVTIRNIEFDGRTAATAGAQVLEEQDAVIKLVSLCMSQEELALAMPFARIETEGEGADAPKVIKNPKCGIIPETAYCKNITVFAKLISGKYKKITIYTPMSENGLGVKAAPKAEGELSLEIKAHQTLDDLNGDLWEVKDVTQIASKAAAAAASTDAGEPAANET